MVVCRQKMVAAMLEMEVHKKRMEDADTFLRCAQCGGVRLVDFGVDGIQPNLPTCSAFNLISPRIPCENL